eukprot:CAMPEP_0198494068 /NCGR_PEP_ID=MMETSP1462-20131121/4420_1 /TAXON_ID=1333877 /ORGANISM="Brandtodinium nutriculum, Strain RCC3387" /LENGTH=519 /DNA_ID=CAMNT_0044222795 /DNA_START=10 /DNA_END=1569 /DNA_ORIENTATION=+
MATLLASGRNVRVDPNRATIDDFPDFQKMKPEKAEKKLALLKDGANTKTYNGPMPDERSCQDALWIVLFLVTAVVILAWGAIRSDALIKAVSEAADRATTAPPSSEDGVDLSFDWAVELTAKRLLVTLVVAACSSMIACLAFIVMAHRAPSCVVWSSLVLCPILMMLAGLICLVGGGAIIGLIFVALGALTFCINFFCYRHLIPFMVQVTEVVADVIEDHPCMMTVGFFGTLIGFVWVVAMALAFAAISYDLRSNHDVDMDNRPVHYACIFGSSLVFLWGLGVATNVCHVTYCGVFGHWYYKAGAADNSDSEDVGTKGALVPAMGVALGTSLGSICFGSLLVAIVRALEQVARQIMNDAQEDGNPLMCVLGCLLTCIIDCIGDMLEYFNDWAYVQCAVRGVSFMDAAKITYSMMTCANMKYIMSDLLLNSVVSFGTLAVAVIATLTTALATGAVYGTGAAAVGAIMGFFIGLMAGAAALGVVNSGVKTLLACWADDPAPLEHTHPQVHHAFMEKLQAME